MVRRHFLKMTGFTLIGIPIMAFNLSACSSIHYVVGVEDSGKLIIPKSEFVVIKDNKESWRNFVFVKSDQFNAPICLYRITKGKYYASLMKCTHRGCELNITGQSYTCPCHGSQFTIKGDVINGPAIRDLTTFHTTIDNNNIYVFMPRLDIK